MIIMRAHREIEAELTNIHGPHILFNQFWPMDYKQSFPD